MTVDEFLRIHGDEDDRYELIEGEACERDLNGYAHDRVKNNLKELFDQAGVGSYGFPIPDRSKFPFDEFQRSGARRGNRSKVTP